MTAPADFTALTILDDLYKSRNPFYTAKRLINCSITFAFYLQTLLIYFSISTYLNSLQSRTHTDTAHNQQGNHDREQLLILYIVLYWAAQKSFSRINGNAHVSTVTQFIERYHGTVNSALNMDDLISNSFLSSVSNKEIYNAI